MRISTSQYYTNSTSNYSKGFSDTAKTQEQISTGKRIQTAADDPIGASKLLQLQQQSSVLTQYSQNTTLANNSLNSEESVLANVTTALQRAQELAVEAGNGALTDDDRASISSEIGQIKQTIYGLLNTKDSNGQYLFSGSKTNTQPYLLNSDGTYTYQGDETQLSLQVSDTLSVATNDTGFSIFDLATNTSRTLTTQTAGTADGKLAVSNGQLNSLTSYNKSFTAGQPYTLTFSSGTAYTVTDASGNDITAQTSGKGVWDSTKEGGSTISVYGVDFGVNMTLSSGDTAATVLDPARSFTLQAKPDTITTNRIATNTSTAQMTTGSVTDSGTYTAAFPTGGAVIKFTNDSGEYSVYAQPLTDSSKPIATGTYDGSGSLTTAGVTFAVSGTPADNDQFTVSANTHSTQNILDTLNQLQTALSTPTTGDAAAQRALKNALESAIGNIGSASTRVDTTRGSIGARQNVLDIQSNENQSLQLANASTQSDIGDTDMAAATSKLTLQQTMLQAAQLSFAKISQLSLFDKL
ncbi:flagellar hook-associated protein 3 [Pseudomonas sp. NPDC007930]|uniref:flagellar hook-associated protein 3 n=1 Tax=Pseudomonas sp. NPDC007930 TaxID=3364417 RepID=UPI0036EC4345